MIHPLIRLFNYLTSKSLREVKRVIRVVLGFTVLLIGIALIVLPGPAFIVIPAGLALLAGEFVWARKILKQFHAGLLIIFRRNGKTTGNKKDASKPDP